MDKVVVDVQLHAPQDLPNWTIASARNIPFFIMLQQLHCIVFLSALFAFSFAAPQSHPKTIYSSKIFTALIPQVYNLYACTLLEAATIMMANEHKQDYEVHCNIDTEKQQLQFQVASKNSFAKTELAGQTAW
jgi:hypothetical protein